jgi:hypothetical protein
MCVILFVVYLTTFILARYLLGETEERHEKPVRIPGLRAEI